jgi:cell division septal protein FtsQ
VRPNNAFLETEPVDALEDAPLPHEFGLGGEPPYRRPKMVAVRQRRFATTRAVIRFFLALICFGLPLAFGFYELAIYARRTPLLLMKPDELRIKGNNQVPRAEVLSALGMDRPLIERSGVQLWRLDLGALRSRVEAIPWVESAALVRAFPHRLQVRLSERHPVGFINVGGQIKLIDSSGIILEPPKRAKFDFPVIGGLDSLSSIADRKARLSLYLDFNQETAHEASRSGWNVSEVDLTDGQDLKALLVKGADTVLASFGQRDFRERFRRFVALMPQVLASGTKVSTMDLRYPDQVVVNPARPQQNGVAVKAHAGSAAKAPATSQH